MQHAYHRVPVTALTFTRRGVLLAGQGNYLSIDLLDERIKVFDDQAIHGITLAGDGEHAVVWGGRSLRLLTISSRSLDISPGILYTAEDWILDAAFVPSPDDSECTVGVITAHGAFWTVRYEDASDYEHEAFAPEGVFERAVSGSNCILYSAHMQWLSESHCLIASGTAFGDVILWSAFFEEGKPTRSQVHFTFSAHEGSVFDVQISSLLQLPDTTEEKRLLATCSDDRTIRLWDITELSAESQTLTQVQRDTGFGVRHDADTHAPPLLAKVMAHTSRIWHVRFLHDALLPEVTGPRIVSCGEDACTNIWHLRPAPTAQAHPYDLALLQSRSSHNGKNIWSVAQHQSGLVTGGADGQIAHYSKLSGYSSTSEVSRSLLASADPSGRDNYKAYAFIWSSDSLLMTTEQGRVVVMDDRYREPATLTELAPPLSGLRGYSVVAGVEKTAFASGTDGAIYCYTRAGRDGYKSTTLLKIAQRSGKTAGLFASALGEDMVFLLATGIGSAPASLYTLRKQGDEWPPFEYHGLNTSLLALPHNEIVTSFAVHEEDGSSYAFVGSRSGSILIYSFQQAQTTASRIDSVYTQDRIHGKEAITAIYLATRSSQRQEAGSHSTFALSTGRDGTLAIHRVAFSTSAPPSLHLVHQLTLPLGPNIEGLGFPDPTFGHATNKVFVWGFQGKDFVQYDTAQQQEVLRVECGGAHRNWAFEPTAHGNGGTLVWTQAGRVRKFEQFLKDVRMIGDGDGAGGHGREIKACAISDRVERGMRILATGAEDTDIKLFGLRDLSVREKGQESCWQTLRKHNTGIQHLAWDGLYLFSSGGFEEFFIWRIEPDVPCFEVGVVCVASHPRSGKSDLRICGFDVRRMESSGEEGEGEVGFEIRMVYSDSTVRLWRYRNGGWDLLKAGEYLTSCLTHVFQPSHRDGGIITAATDGHLALWRTSDKDEASALTWHTRHKVHQSAIHALTSRTLADDSTLIATGGDDNALALTRLSTDGRVKTLIIPSAHAAAVTGLALVPLDNTTSTFTSSPTLQVFQLVSASIDQRLKLWRLTVDTAQAGIEGVKVERVQSVFTAVADVSSLETCLLDEGDRGVVVCGVGVDVWKIPQDKKQGGNGGKDEGGTQGRIDA